MALTNEDLLAISSLLDAKLKPIDNRTKRLELLIENEVLPRLSNIENCYTTTYNRYVDGVEQIEAMKMDIDDLKKTVIEHSEKLQKIS